MDKNTEVNEFMYAGEKLARDKNWYPPKESEPK